MAKGLARPLALASGDFDEDGVQDLVSGYASPGSGILTLHRGNVESLLPGHRRPETSDYNRHPSPFLFPARVFEMPEAPGFLGTGDFDADGHWDVVTAAHGSHFMYLLSGDGYGGFGPAKPIELPGEITVLVAGEINRADGLSDVVIGVTRPDGSSVFVFESLEKGALSISTEIGDGHRAQASQPAPVQNQGQTVKSALLQPEVLDLPKAATALTLGQLDESYETDLAVAAGNELLIVHGRDRMLTRYTEVQPPTIDQYSFPFSITSIALGDFVCDENHRAEIALLAVDGIVHVMQKSEGKGRRDEAVEWQIGDREDVHMSSADSNLFLVRAKVSASRADDLLLVNQARHRLHILTDGDGAEKACSFLDMQGAPVAVMPMRLNTDALSDLVILNGSGLTVMLTELQAAYTVTNANNSGPGSLRQAIIDANAEAGADLTAFDIRGPGPYTIRPTSPLPPIATPMTIDGTTEPDFAGTPIIEVDGSLAGETYGLYIWGGNKCGQGAGDQSICMGWNPTGH